MEFSHGSNSCKSVPVEEGREPRSKALLAVRKQRRAPTDAILACALQQFAACQVRILK